MKIVARRLLFCCCCFLGPVCVFCSSPLIGDYDSPAHCGKNSLCFTDLCAERAFHTLNRVPLLGRFVFRTIATPFPLFTPPLFLLFLFFFFVQQTESVNKCFTVLTVMPKIQNTKQHTALLWFCRVADLWLSAPYSDPYSPISFLMSHECSLETSIIDVDDWGKGRAVKKTLFLFFVFVIAW